MWKIPIFDPYGQIKAHVCIFYNLYALDATLPKPDHVKNFKNKTFRDCY